MFLEGKMLNVPTSIFNIWKEKFLIYTDFFLFKTAIVAGKGGGANRQTVSEVGLYFLGKWVSSSFIFGNFINEYPSLLDQRKFFDTSCRLWLKNLIGYNPRKLTIMINFINIWSKFIQYNMYHLVSLYRSVIQLIRHMLYLVWSRALYKLLFMQYDFQLIHVQVEVNI